jgi:putative membrane protein
MIRGYTDHSANERTFLAWVRTGIAVTAFGFLVEKFKLFTPAAAAVSASDSTSGPASDGLVKAIGHYDGLALAVLGTVVIVVAAVRFIRIRAALDDAEVHRVANVRLGLAFSVVLALIIAATSAYLAVS